MEVQENENDQYGEELEDAYNNNQQQSESEAGGQDEGNGQPDSDA